MREPMTQSVDSTELPVHTWHRVALFGILLVSLVINLTGLRWGLPNGNQTWAADALQPMTPMAVGKHVLFGDGWNSGWFYFKYPVGHPLLVLSVQSPYLAWAWLHGELEKPSSEYPFGFKHPEESLERLALLNRLLSAFMGAGVVWFAYVTGRMLFDRSAGLASSIIAAGTYPLVFYSHTSNVDTPLLFWIAAALAATLWSAQKDSLLASAAIGVSAALALLTKEQSVGALAPLPLVWLLARPPRSDRDRQSLLRHALTAAGAFVLVTVVCANVLWNPSGYVNRWRFLMGTLPQEVREKYAPYQFLVQVPKEFSWVREIQKVGKVALVVADGLTLPVAFCGLAGFVLAARRRWRSVLILCVAIAAYHVLSLRALELAPVRYVMPLLYLVLLAAGAAVAFVLRSCARAAAWVRAIGAVITAAAVVLTLVPGIEVVRLLRNDPRYEAEAWLQDQAFPRARIEVYQPMTYLPRFEKEWIVTRIPVAERTTALFAGRKPDFVVLSGGGRAGLTGKYARNWQPGQAIFTDSDAAKSFLEELRSGQLGYYRAAEFHNRSSFIDARINSLSPTITIYARNPIS